MYRKLWFLSNSKLVGQYCGTLWTNHDAGEDINLGHDIIKGKVKAHKSIEQKHSFEKSSFQWFSASQNMTETDEGTTQIVCRLLATL
jgi:hypothetical protein